LQFKSGFNNPPHTFCHGALIHIPPTCVRSVRLPEWSAVSLFLLAYSDCFLILGCVLLASVAALLFMKKATIEGPVGGH